MAKVKRNLRFGKVFDDLENELGEGETMTNLLEALMQRELARRRRSNRGAPPAAG